MVQVGKVWSPVIGVGYPPKAPETAPQMELEYINF